MTIACIGPINTEWHTTRYRLNSSSGYMIEGEFEGLVPMSRSIRGLMWVRGHYDQVDGKGSLTSTVTFSTIAAVPPGTVDLDNSAIYKSYFAAGLGIEASF